MNKSDSINELSAALSKAQATIQTAKKDSSNPFFKSKYADLASVWDAIRRPLSENGLCVMQPTSVDDSKVTVTTVLSHSSGQWMSGDLTITAKDSSAQSVGSAITYARRYGLQSMTGVAPDDDDGEGSQPRSQYQEPKRDGRPAAPPAPKPAPKETDMHGEIVEPEVMAIWQRMGTKAATIIDEFQELKQGLMEACGGSAGEAEYRRVLGTFGYSKSNEFIKGPLASTSNARKALRSLWHALQAAKELGVQEGDIVS